MNRIAALNDSSSCEYSEDFSSSRPVATKEAQEDEALELHKDALLLQQKGDIEGAKEVLETLIEHPFFLQCASRSSDTENIAGPGHILKYSTYKNLAAIATQQKRWEDAMDYFQDAIAMDDTDVSIWYKMGNIALELHNYPLARHSFEEALKCNPRHWPSLDKVITVVYALGDYSNCLHAISKALERDSGYVKGQCLRKQIYEENPSLQANTAHLFKGLDSDTLLTEVDQKDLDEFVSEAHEMREKKRALVKTEERPIVKFIKPLKSLTWKNLGECVLDLYDSINKQMQEKKVTRLFEPKITLTNKVDLSMFKDVNSEEDLKVQADPVDAPDQTSKQAEESGEAKKSDEKTEETPGKENPEPMDTATATDGEGDGKADEATDKAEQSADPQSGSGMSSIKKAPGSKKGAKKKQQWWYDEAMKRRSSRVRNVRTVKKPDEEKVDHGEMIRKILPQALLVINENEKEEQPVNEESSKNSKTVEDSKMEANESSTNSKHLKLEATEKENVLDFLKRHATNYGVLHLLDDFVHELVKRNNEVWPGGLKAIFLKACDRFYNHFELPDFLSDDHSHSYVHDVAMMCLMVSEFKLDAWLNNKTSTPGKGKTLFKDICGDHFDADLEYLVMLTPFRCIMADDWFSFVVRVFWCRARRMAAPHKNNKAISAFNRALEHLAAKEEESVSVTLLNCQSDGVISKETIQKHMDTLKCTQSLDEVNERHNTGDHEHVIDLIVETFTEKKSTSSNTLGARHEQLILLQDSLLKINNPAKCVLWMEVAFNEALEHHFESHKESNKQQWLETVAKLMDGLEQTLQKRESYKVFKSKNKCRLTENLLKILEMAMEQSELGGDIVKITIMPWILLYWLIKYEEDEMRDNGTYDEMLLEDDSLEENMSPSLGILNLAHELISRQSRCTIHEGKLLLFTVERFNQELNSVKEEDEPHPFKQEIHNAIEQCYLCLYGHPNKRRGKHLQEHNAPPVPLSWEPCIPLFEYFKPKTIPEYDSLKSESISAELANLLRRICHLVPDICQTSLTVDCIGEYVKETTTKPPTRKESKEWPVIPELYYLLGDYYFKSKESSKAIKHYMHDLTINPDRFDSWAGLALAHSFKLEKQIGSHEWKNEPGAIDKKAAMSLRCFKHALEIDPCNSKLWLEYGGFAYQLHSHASRQLKNQEMYPLGEFLDTTKNSRQEMLELARKCYIRAGEEDSEEELWLHHYMKGKIAEKKRLEPQMYLDNYRKAAEYLHEDKAKYPKKINYIYNPPPLAVEALEMHFKLHVSIIKYLWNNFFKGDDSTRTNIPFSYLEKLVADASESGFAKGIENTDRAQKRAAESETAPGTPTSVRRQRKKAKVQHPDHNYSLIKMTSDSSQESQDCASPIIHPRSSAPVSSAASIHIATSASTGTPVITTSASKSTLNPFTFPAVPPLLPPPARKELAGTMDVKEKATESADAASAMVKAGSSNELEKDVKSEMPALEKMDTEEGQAAEKVEEASKEVNVKESTKEDSEDNKMDTEEKEEKSSDEKDDEIKIASEEKKMDVREGKEKGSDLEGKEQTITVEKGKDVEKSGEKVINTDKDDQSADTVESVNKSKDKETEEKKVEDMNARTDQEEDVNIERPREVMDAETGEKVTKDNVDANKDETVKDNQMANNAPPTAVEGTSSELQKEKSTDSEQKIQQDTEQKKLESQETTHEAEQLDGDAVKKPNEMEIDDKKETENTTPKEKETTTEHGEGDKENDKKETGQNNTTTCTEVDTKTSDKTDPKDRYHQLMWKCIAALELCLSRFPQHYKALYHLAHIYAESDFTKHLPWARDLLLGPQVKTKSWQLPQHMPCPGLFQDRKNTNFFNGLWRIPIEEIDRPGSFMQHLSQCIRLMFDILTQLKDTNMLFRLFNQLSKDPEQGKKYLRDVDREYFAQDAYMRCLSVLEKEAETYKPADVSSVVFPVEATALNADQKFLLFVFKVWRYRGLEPVRRQRANLILARLFCTIVRRNCSPTEDMIPMLLDQAKMYCDRLATAGPGPGRPKASVKSDDGKRAPGSEMGSTNPASPAPKPDEKASTLSKPPTLTAVEPTAAEMPPAPNRPIPSLPKLARSVQSSAGTSPAPPDLSGNDSDSSYKASQDSASSSEEEEMEDESVILIKDSPVKNSPVFQSFMDCKSPPIPQRTNIFTSLSSPPLKKPAGSEMPAQKKPLGSDMPTQKRAPGSAMPTQKKPTGSFMPTQKKPPGSEMPTQKKPTGSGMPTLQPYQSPPASALPPQAIDASHFKPSVSAPPSLPKVRPDQKVAPPQKMPNLQHAKESRREEPMENESDSDVIMLDSD